MAEFGQSGCTRVKVVVLEQFDGIRKKWWCSDKSVCTRAKVIVFGQSGCIRSNVAVFGTNGCIRDKVVVFGQTLLY